MNRRFFMQALGIVLGGLTSFGRRIGLLPAAPAGVAPEVAITSIDEIAWQLLSQSDEEIARRLRDLRRDSPETEKSVRQRMMELHNQQCNARSLPGSMLPSYPAPEGEQPDSPVKAVCFAGPAAVGPVSINTAKTVVRVLREDGKVVGLNKENTIESP